jgi:RNA recognition motif-containing protein
VFVVNLGFDATDDGIRAHFQTAGDVVVGVDGVTHARDYKGKSRGYAYVTFTTAAAATAAVSSLHLSKLAGYVVQHHVTPFRVAPHT